jgi:hypothetical protein
LHQTLTSVSSASAAAVVMPCLGRCARLATRGCCERDISHGHDSQGPRCCSCSACCCCWYCALDGVGLSGALH